MTRRSKTFTIILVIAAAILILTVAYFQRRADQSRKHPQSTPSPTASSSPESSVATLPPSPALVSGKSEKIVPMGVAARKAASAAKVSRETLIVPMSTPTPDYNEPRRVRRLRDVYFSGQTIYGITLAPGLLAVVEPVGEPPLEPCRAGNVPLGIQCTIPQGSVQLRILRCLKVVNNRQVPDSSCEAARLRYR